QESHILPFSTLFRSGLDVPAEGLEALGVIAALRLVGHGVEGDVVGVVNEDEVVQLLVGGKGDGLKGDAFLHAAVTAESDHVVVRSEEHTSELQSREN